MFEVRMALADQLAVKVTLSITMALQDWQSLGEQLGKGWPSWKLASEISSVIRKVQQTFLPDTPREDE